MLITDEALTWVREQLCPQRCASTEFIYDLMDSQSGFCLPVIYQPFDPQRRAHFADRGQILDFLHSVGGGEVLDFGPGDGWPALPLAPLMRSVTGVDASARRVETCIANAQRLGLGNVSFVHSAPGAALPFDDGSFDGATAASSVEQTPEPLATLTELCRVLKRGGRLRMHYESLTQYRGGREREWLVLPDGGGASRLLLFDRAIDDEYADQYRIDLALPAQEVQQQISGMAGGAGASAAGQAPVLGADGLRALARHISSAAQCRTSHPGGRTFAALLHQAGFEQVLATHDGGAYAHSLFDLLPSQERPATLEETDRLLSPAVRIVCRLPAPIETNPLLTAVKR
jgi:SAM-dependent methyltransferase